MARLIAAGDYATPGERKVADTLKGLPPTWFVVTNKLLVTASGRSFELDFIVVGERCVFILDEKSWRGRIVGTDQVWVRSDGSSERSPLSKADYLSRVLKGELAARVAALKLPDQFVFGCVVLSDTTQLPQLRDPRAPNSVFLIDHVVDQLVARDRVAGHVNVGLSHGAIERALVNLGPRPKVPKAIDFYEIREAHDLRDGVRVMDAIIASGGDRRLLVYSASGQEAEFLMREFKAVQELRSTKAVTEIGDPFKWSDDFVVLPVPLPPGRSWGSLPPLSFEHDALVAELEGALAAYSSLVAIHAKKIVHRSIDPDDVFTDATTDPPRVYFTDFHAARVGSKSIAQQLDETEEVDAYTAPELSKGFGNASEHSDVFSLGLCVCERMTGLRAREIRSGQFNRARLSEWNTLRDGLDGELDAFFALALAADPTSRPSAQDCVDLLTEMLTSLAPSGGPGSQLLLDDRYEVVRKLGEGISAVTYLVRDRDFDLFFAVKRFKRATTVIEQVRAEFEALRGIHSPHLPKVYDIYPPSADVHLKMEYIAGPTLADLVETAPWPLDRWLRLARPLFQAIATLEAKGLLHRDIKPANIVLREADETPVLVDFGYSTVARAYAPPAGTPRYAPPEAGSSDRPPASSDRFAAGVLLGQFLFGQAHQAVTNQEPLSLETLQAERLRGFLARLTDLNPDKRFQSIDETLTALDLALQVPDARDAGGVDRINPWVEQLRRTYRNSRIGNQDNRGLDSDFARQTYVPTALDAKLLPLILTKRPRAVFLSGNPGDGKTSFLEMVEARLTETSAILEAKDDAGWSYRLGSHHFVSCFDASEAHGVLSADQQLDGRLTPLAGEQDPRVAVTVLVAINDGRLADFLERFSDRYPWLERATQRARSEWVPADPVWLVDLKRRSLFAPSADQSSVMSRLVDVLTNQEHWQICTDCASSAMCPILKNAGDLQRSDSTVRRRFDDLLSLAQLRLLRHVTIRDLRSTIGFLITGDSSCEEIHAERAGSSSIPITRRWFWQSLFQRSDGDDPLRHVLSSFDPANSATPHLDRFLGFRSTPNHANERRALFEDAIDVPPELFPSTREWIGAVKRRLYFLGRETLGDDRSGLADTTPRSLLPYRHAVEFIEALGDAGRRRSDLPRLLRGISRSDGVVLAPTHIGLSLRVAVSESERLVIVKQFDVSRFDLRAEGGEATSVEAMATALVLELRGSGIRVRVTLDLYELLRRFAEGLRPDAEEFHALLADLTPFKNALLLRETKQLVLIENGVRLQSVTVQGPSVVREVLA